MASNWTLSEDRSSRIINAVSDRTNGRHRMEGLFVAALVIAAIVILDMLAIAFGADSREGFRR